MFRRALRTVGKSGEVWCEGARLFLNPCGALFSPRNAAQCLRLAMFFTPQYSDSYVEVGASRGAEAQAVRLLLVTSDALLWFHDCASRRALELLLAADPAVEAFVGRAAMEGPNYGGNWFRCKEFAEATALEVLLRCVAMVAREVACEAELYVDALRRCALRERRKRERREKGLEEEEEEREKEKEEEKKKKEWERRALRARFSMALSLHYMESAERPCLFDRNSQFLYSASQMEN